MKRSVVDFPNFVLAAALLLAACSTGRQFHPPDGGDGTGGGGGGKGTAGSAGGASGRGGAQGGGGSAGVGSGTGGTASGGTGGTGSGGTGGTASGGTGGTGSGGTGGTASGGTGGTGSGGTGGKATGGTGGTGTGGTGTGGTGTGGTGTGGTGTGGTGTGGTGTGGTGTGGTGTGGTGTGGTAGAGQAGGSGGAKGTGGGSGGAPAPLSIQVVDGRSTATSTTFAQVSPACPSPKTAIGAGWQLLTSGLVADDGYLTYSLPAYDGSSWLVNASPVNSSTPWMLDVSLECATVTGYQLVTVTSPLDATTPKSITATCPAGKQALGAGWGVLNSTAAILEGTALQFQLAADGTSWTVAASSLAGTSDDPWELRETVICAPASAVPGYQIVSAMSTLATGTRQQLRTACPSPKRAIMGGWSLVDGSNAPTDGTAFLSDYSVGGTAWDTTVITPQSTTTALQVRVVCAN